MESGLPHLNLFKLCGALRINLLEGIDLFESTQWILFMRNHFKIFIYATISLINDENKLVAQFKTLPQLHQNEKDIFTIGEEYVYENVSSNWTLCITLEYFLVSSKVSSTATGNGQTGKLPSLIGEVKIPIHRLEENMPILQWYQLFSAVTDGLRSAIKVEFLFVNDGSNRPTNPEKLLPNSLLSRPGGRKSSSDDKAGQLLHTQTSIISTSYDKIRTEAIDTFRDSELNTPYSTLNYNTLSSIDNRDTNINTSESSVPDFNRGDAVSQVNNRPHRSLEHEIHDLPRLLCLDSAPDTQTNKPSETDASDSQGNHRKMVDFGIVDYCLVLGPKNFQSLYPTHFVSPDGNIEALPLDDGHFIQSSHPEEVIRRHPLLHNVLIVSQNRAEDKSGHTLPSLNDQTSPYSANTMPPLWWARSEELDISLWDRIPQMNYPDVEIPNKVEWFACPEGSKSILQRQRPDPFVNSFILSASGDEDHQYGLSLNFFVDTGVYDVRNGDIRSETLQHATNVNQVHSNKGSIAKSISQINPLEGIETRRKTLKLTESTLSYGTVSSVATKWWRLNRSFCSTISEESLERVHRLESHSNLFGTNSFTMSNEVYREMTQSSQEQFSGVESSTLGIAEIRPSIHHDHGTTDVLPDPNNSLWTCVTITLLFRYPVVSQLTECLIAAYKEAILPHLIEWEKFYKELEISNRSLKGNEPLTSHNSVHSLAFSTDNYTSQDKLADLEFNRLPQHSPLSSPFSPKPTNISHIRSDSTIFTKYEHSSCVEFVRRCVFPLYIERLMALLCLEIPVPLPGLLDVDLHLPGISGIRPAIFETNRSMYQYLDPKSFALKKQNPFVDRGSLFESFNPKCIRFSIPSDDELPTCLFPIATCLNYLGPRTLLDIVQCTLSECKMLFHSNDLARLPMVCETVRCLIYPLRWTHVYLPVVPVQLLSLLEAPVPFMLGTHSKWLRFIDSEYLRDTVLIDCDSGAIDIGGALVARFPVKEERWLMIALNFIMRTQKGFNIRTSSSNKTKLWDTSGPSLHNEDTPKSIQDLGLMVQLIFFDVMLNLLRYIPDCLFYLNPTCPVFNRPLFLSDYTPDESKELLEFLSTTNSFHELIETIHSNTANFFLDSVYRLNELEIFLLQKFTGQQQQQQQLPNVPNAVENPSEDLSSLGVLTSATLDVIQKSSSFRMKSNHTGLVMGDTKNHSISRNNSFMMPRGRTPVAGKLLPGVIEPKPTKNETGGTLGKSQSFINQSNQNKTLGSSRTFSMRDVLYEKYLQNSVAAAQSTVNSQSQIDTSKTLHSSKSMHNLSKHRSFRQPFQSMYNLHDINETISKPSKEFASFSSEKSATDVKPSVVLVEVVVKKPPEVVAEAPKSTAPDDIYGSLSNAIANALRGLDRVEKTSVLPLQNEMIRLLVQQCNEKRYNSTYPRWVYQIQLAFLHDGVNISNQIRALPIKALIENRISYYFPYLKQFNAVEKVDETNNRKLYLKLEGQYTLMPDTHLLNPLEARQTNRIDLHPSNMYNSTSSRNIEMLKSWTDFSNENGESDKVSSSSRNSDKNSIRIIRSQNTSKDKATDYEMEDTIFIVKSPEGIESRKLIDLELSLVRVTTDEGEGDGGSYRDFTSDNTPMTSEKTAKRSDGSRDINERMDELQVMDSAKSGLDAGHEGDVMKEESEEMVTIDEKIEVNEKDLKFVSNDEPPIRFIDSSLKRAQRNIHKWTLSDLAEHLQIPFDEFWKLFLIYEKQHRHIANANMNLSQQHEAGKRSDGNQDVDYSHVTPQKSFVNYRKFIKQYDPRSTMKKIQTAYNNLNCDESITKFLQKAVTEVSFTPESLQESLDETLSKLKLSHNRLGIINILKHAKKSDDQNKEDNPAVYPLNPAAFEALCGLFTGLLNICANEQDYLCAYGLLEVGGTYFRFLPSTSLKAHSFDETSMDVLEFLSERTCHHPIYQNPAMWIAVMNDRLPSPRLISSVTAAANNHTGILTTHSDFLSVSLDDVKKYKSNGLSLQNPKEMSADPTLNHLLETSLRQTNPQAVISEAQSLLYIMLGMGVNSARAVLFIQSLATEYKLSIDEYLKLQRFTTRLWTNNHAWMDKRGGKDKQNEEESGLFVRRTGSKYGGQRHERSRSNYSIQDMLSMQGHSHPFSSQDQIPRLGINRSLHNGNNPAASFSARSLDLGNSPFNIDKSSPSDELFRNFSTDVIDAVAVAAEAANDSARRKTEQLRKLQSNSDSSDNSENMKRNRFRNRTPRDLEHILSSESLTTSSPTENADSGATSPADSRVRFQPVALDRLQKDAVMENPNYNDNRVDEANERSDQLSSQIKHSPQNENGFVVPYDGNSSSDESRRLRDVHMVFSLPQSRASKLQRDPSSSTPVGKSNSIMTSSQKGSYEPWKLQTVDHSSKHVKNRYNTMAFESTALGYCSAYHAMGRWLIAGTDEGNMYVVDMCDGKTQLKLKHSGGKNDKYRGVTQITSIGSSSSGRIHHLFFSGCSNGIVKAWSLPQKLIDEDIFFNISHKDEGGTDRRSSQQHYSSWGSGIRFHQSLAAMKNDSKTPQQHEITCMTSDAVTTLNIPSMGIEWLVAAGNAAGQVFLWKGSGVNENSVTSNTMKSTNIFALRATGKSTGASSSSQRSSCAVSALAFLGQPMNNNNPSAATKRHDLKINEAKPPSSSSSSFEERLVAGTLNGIITVIDIITGVVVHRVDAHKGKVSQIIGLRPNEFITSSMDRSLKLWDIRVRNRWPVNNSAPSNRSLEGRTIGQDNLKKSSCSPITSVAVGGFDNTMVISGDGQGIIRIWDLRYDMNNPCTVYKAHSDRITGLLWDGKENFHSSSMDGTVKSWDSISGICTNLIQQMDESYKSFGSIANEHYSVGVTQMNISSFLYPTSVTNYSFSALSEENEKMIGNKHSSNHRERGSKSYMQFRNTVVTTGFDGILRINYEDMFP